MRRPTSPGPNTNLQRADFSDANVSGASFASADITGAQFTGARAVGTDFSGVRANSAVFADAHLYGDGQAFDDATDLRGVDFSSAVLAGDASQSGGFDLTGAPLTGAHFDGAVCVACNLTGATLDGATFIGPYLPGVELSQATLTNASFDRAWLYCGSLDQRLVHAGSDVVRAVVVAADVGLRRSRPARCPFADHGPDRCLDGRRRRVSGRHAAGGARHRAARASCCRRRRRRRCCRRRARPRSAGSVRRPPPRCSKRPGRASRWRLQRFRRRAWNTTAARPGLLRRSRRRHDSSS